MEILVAYFSPTETTKEIAGIIADELKADLFQIHPKRPYTPGDLNWMNPLSRCNREKLFKKDVPCKEKIGNFSDYKAVFLGFPIWYYAEPRIIDSFVKDYDWKYKEIFLFATSGSTGITQAKENLEKLMGHEVRDARLIRDPYKIGRWLDELCL